MDRYPAINRDSGMNHHPDRNRDTDSNYDPDKNHDSDSKTPKTLKYFEAIKVLIIIIIWFNQLITTK